MLACRCGSRYFLQCRGIRLPLSTILSPVCFSDWTQSSDLSSVQIGVPLIPSSCFGTRPWNRSIPGPEQPITISIPTRPTSLGARRFPVRRRIHGSERSTGSSGSSISLFLLFGFKSGGTDMPRLMPRLPTNAGESGFPARPAPLARSLVWKSTALKARTFFRRAHSVSHRGCFSFGFLFACMVGTAYDIGFLSGFLPCASMLIGDHEIG